MFETVFNSRVECIKETRDRFLRELARGLLINEISSRLLTVVRVILECLSRMTNL